MFSSSAGCTTDERALRAARRRARAGDGGRVAARAAVDIAARLCGVDRVPSGRVLGAVRSARAADARELPHRLARRAVRALLRQYLPAGEPGARLPAGAVHARGLLLRAFFLRRARDRLRACASPT